MQQMILEAVYRPQFVHAFCDIIHDWEMHQLRMLTETSVPDMVIINGFYETPLLWSPESYREFLKPRFKEKIDLIHNAGMKCGYFMSTKVMPLLDDFREIGLDVLYYVDPVQGDVNLRELKKRAGDFLCFHGGVNGALTVGHGSRGEVREAVREAIHILAPGGGFILSAADAIYCDAPWPNVIAMIEAWRRWREYPIGTVKSGMKKAPEPQKTQGFSRGYKGV